GAAPGGESGSFERDSSSMAPTLKALFRFRVGEREDACAWTPRRRILGGRPIGSRWEPDDFGAPEKESIRWTPRRAARTSHSNIFLFSALRCPGHGMASNVSSETIRELSHAEAHLGARPHRPAHAALGPPLGPGGARPRGRRQELDP